MDTQSSQSTRPCRKSLTRDQRVAVQTRRRYGLSLQAIANQLRISPRQVKYACQRSDVSDTRSPDRPPVLSSEQMEELVEYIRSSEDGRFMTYFELAIYPFAHWNVGEIAIRGALRRRGYRRCISQCKPPLTLRTCKSVCCLHGLTVTKQLRNGVRYFGLMNHGSLEASIDVCG